MKRRLVYVLGLAMLISFSACSSDDDYKEEEGGDSEQSTDARRISKIILFDKDGKEKEDANRYQYSENKIDCEGYFENILEFKDDKIELYVNYETGNIPEILELKDGLITQKVSRDLSYRYEYDDNYLSTVLNGDVVTKFYYTNGNLSTIKEISNYDEKEDVIITYTYYDYSDKLGFVSSMAEFGYIGHGTIRFGNSLYQMGYYGTQSKNLVKTCTYTPLNSNSSSTIYLSYKFDDLGYVTEIAKKSIGEGYQSNVTFKIEYENKSIESILTK